MGCKGSKDSLRSTKPTTTVPSPRTKLTICLSPKTPSPIPVPPSCFLIAKVLQSQCHRCGYKSNSAEDLLFHMNNSCQPQTCPHCNDLCFPTFMVECSGQFSKVPRAPEPLESASIEMRAAALIQRFLRNKRIRRIFSSGAFTAMQHELDHSRESETMHKLASPLRSDSILPEGSVPPVKKRSVLVNHCTKNDIPEDHYFPKTHDKPLTKEVVMKLSQDFSHGGKLPYAAAWRILEDAIEILFNRNNIQEVHLQEKGKVIVVGDLHGQIQDLLHILGECGTPSRNVLYIFNGDFVDRGAHGLEILLLLLSLLVVFPEYVYLNRGNHEVGYMNESYGFDIEVATKYDRAMYHFVQRIFNVLPLACNVVESKKATTTFVVHGGIPRSEGITLDYINRMNRKRPIPYPEDGQPVEDEVFQDMLWADPAVHKGCSESDRGVGYRWGVDISEAFMKLNKIHLILRSHEQCTQGYEEHHHGKVYTVFSASDYDGTGTNSGAYVVLSVKEKPKFNSYKADEIDLHLRSHGSTVVLGHLYSNYAMTNTSLVAPDSPNESSQRSAKDGVLSYVRGRIYLKRHTLLTFFHALDPNRTGKVYLADWVAAMQNIVNRVLPWLLLRSHFIHVDSEKKIDYMSFLYRYETVFMLRWSSHWKHRVAHKLAVALSKRDLVLYPGHFGANATSQTWCSFEQVKAVISHFEEGLSSSEIFQLYSFCDLNADGYVKVSDILEIVNQHSGGAITFSPSVVMQRGGKMWELDVIQELQHLFLSGRSFSPLQVFQSMDTDNAGCLTVEKFQKGMTSLNRSLRVPVETSSIPSLFACLDHNDDGRVSLVDFMDAFSVMDKKAVKHPMRAESAGGSYTLNQLNNTSNFSLDAIPNISIGTARNDQT